MATNKLYQPAVRPANQLTAAMNIPNVTGTTSRASYGPNGQVNYFGDTSLNHNSAIAPTGVMPMQQPGQQLGYQPTGMMQGQDSRYGGLNAGLAEQNNNSMLHQSNRAWNENGGVMASPFTLPTDLSKSNSYSPNMFRDQYRTAMTEQYGPQKMLWGQKWNDWATQNGYMNAKPVEEKNTYLGGADRNTGARFYPGGNAKTGGIRQTTRGYDQFGNPING
jgi:hypothetical protein